MIGKTYPITVKELTETKNNLGETVEEWNDKDTVDGVIWQLNGKETYESDKDTRIIKHRMACDITFTITENDRIVYDNRVFDIELVNDVNNLGKRYELDLKEVS